MEYNIFNKDKKERGIFSVLAEAKISEWGRWRKTIVNFEFPSTVLEVVRNPKMYVRLDLLIIRDLKSKHSIALYDFLKDYQNLGRFRCEVVQFRDLMWVGKESRTANRYASKDILDAKTEAKNIESEARNKANKIIGDANNKLESAEREIQELKQRMENEFIESQDDLIAQEVIRLTDIRIEKLGVKQ